MSPVHPDASPHAGEAATTAQRRADALRRAARAKHEAAAARAEAAIRQLVKNQQDISFRSVARTGGISLDFLCASTDLRRRIESLRAQRAGQVPAASAGDVPRHQRQRTAAISRRHHGDPAPGTKPASPSNARPASRARSSHARQYPHAPAAEMSDPNVNIDPGET